MSNDEKEDLIKYTNMSKNANDTLEELETILSDGRIKEGMVFKNYKELCAVLGWEVLTNHSKKAQFKQLDRICQYHKEGHKIFIDSIKNESERNKVISPIVKLNTKYGWMTKEGLHKKYGVYYIIDEHNNIYIGSTIRNFKTRYYSHIQKNNICESAQVVKNNHFYGILQDLTGIEDETLIRLIEGEWINYFRSNQEYNVVNNRVAGDCIQKENRKTLYKNLKLKINAENYEEIKEILLNFVSESSDLYYYILGDKAYIDITKNK